MVQGNLKSTAPNSLAINQIVLFYSCHHEEENDRCRDSDSQRLDQSNVMTNNASSTLSAKK